ncbi:prepilin-type N-terminal cleavage/methylation domain-containing protein [Candidatus Woesebacteria bacterium]|nr:prepilin-type N-terminal cleavage/methylation domain-containing protein [Candidatus Woesebacteria bacterium]
MLTASSLGFTLIELIVSVTIMGLVMGGGIAGYRNFNERQQLITTGKEVLVALRKTQTDAVAGVKSTNCANRTLVSNTFSFSGSAYNIVETCRQGGTTYPFTTRTEQLSPGIEILIDQGSVIFYGQYGGVASPVQITIRKVGTTAPIYRINVNSQGTVEDIGLQ